ncbi:hypothetical protein EYB25_004065 [Talaromyces marneffei]|nr:uncharacterized protein EYB26_004850 [Talaromyces marneffei]KAE8552686.1 hypothetical protein EYB25_004065 [Talaromyces marneffei]QGA17180.1 hypothetical protein EYB26_004850 [Talaromyces marneffei]
MFAVFYESLLSLKLVHDKSNILLLAICVSKACIFAYSIMQYASMHKNAIIIQTNRDMFNQPLVDLSRDLWKEIRPAEMMVPIIVGIATLIVCPIAYQLHKEYSWAIYQCVQGDPKTRFRYRGYEVYLVLILFDLYFLVGFMIQYNLVNVHFIEPEFSLTMALIPTVVMVLVLSVYFVRYENKIGTIIVIISYLGILAYIISRLVVLFGDSLYSKTIGKDMMLLFAFAALIFTFLATACAIYCLLNYDHSLKLVFDRKSQIPRQSFAFQELPNRYNASRESLRMSID